MSRDARYRKLITSARWTALRRAWLAATPLCEECMRRGKVRPAVQVHHRRPVESGATMADMERLAFDADNLESVCQECHADIHKQMRSHRRDRQAEAARRESEINDYMNQLFTP